MGIPTDEDLRLYGAAMEQVKGRLVSAEKFLGLKASHPTVESACLQVRLALEAMMLSSLVPNRAAVAAAASAYARKKHNAALKIIEEVNPHFWPLPVSQDPDDHTMLRPIEEGFLRQDDYLATWGALSAWCHATNPFQDPRDLASGIELVRVTAASMWTLLNGHQRFLVEPGHVVFCALTSATSGGVRVYLMGPP